MEEQNQPTPQGADLHSAADRIDAFLSADEPKKETQEAQPEETQQDQSDELETLSDESEEPTQEAESTDEEAGDETQEADSEETESQKFESIEELAEATGMTMEEFMDSIKGKVKINGVEQEVTLSDLKNGYQMESDYRRKTADLSEQRKAFEKEREEITQELSQKYQEATQVTDFLEQQLMGEYNSIDWNSIRHENPAEFAALKQEYNERYQQIQELKSSAAEQLTQQRQAQLIKEQEAMSAMLAEQSQRLAEVIPEFGDPEKAKTLKAEMRDFLKQNGFEDVEIGQVVDHRQVLLIRDAMAYRNLKSKGVEVKSKVKSAPRLQKPGKKQVTSGEKTQRDKRARLKRTGRVEDAALLIDV